MFFIKVFDRQYDAVLKMMKNQFFYFGRVRQISTSFRPGAVEFPPGKITIFKFFKIASALMIKTDRFFDANQTFKTYILYNLESFPGALFFE